SHSSCDDHVYGVLDFCIHSFVVCLYLLLSFLGSFPTRRSSDLDLILLDVNMPDGNGFDFARELTSEYSIPFLFITAHNLEDEIIDRKSTRLNSSHVSSSYAVFCLQRKN